MSVKVYELNRPGATRKLRIVVTKITTQDSNYARVTRYRARVPGYSFNVGGTTERQAYDRAIERLP